MTKWPGRKSVRIALDGMSPGSGVGIDEASLIGIVQLALQFCRVSMGGVCLDEGGGLRLAAGVGVTLPGAPAWPIPRGDEGWIELRPEPLGAGFAAGVAIEPRDGLRGLLFVCDQAPRPQGLTDQEQSALRLLSHQACLLLAQAAATRTAKLHRDVFRHAEVDLVVIDIGEDGAVRLEDANEVHLAHLGLRREQFAGRTPEEVLGLDGAVIARSKYARVVETGQKLEYEAELPFANGPRVRHSTMTPLFDERGRVAKILLTSLDLTERRRAEAQLRHAQKMQSLGQLTGGVTHDFNNLLSIVMGGLELIERQLPKLADGPAAERIRRAHELALQGAERAATLTKRLLAFSRRQNLAPEAVDVNRLVSEMSDMLMRTLGKMITCEIKLTDGLWIVRADGHELDNALLNLALNARDAMPEGGRLTIETGNVRLDAAYAASLEEPVLAGDYVFVAVSDTGCGMDPETAERAFEPFFTTKDVAMGTGLGLSQVYGFVRQSGGHLRLCSAPGEGTTMTIYLPRLIPSG